MGQEQTVVDRLQVLENKLESGESSTSPLSLGDLHREIASELMKKLSYDTALNHF